MFYILHRFNSGDFFCRLNREDFSTAESLKRMNLVSHDSLAQDKLDMSTLESLVKMLRVQAQDIAKLQSQVDYLMNENQKLSGLQQKVDSLTTIPTDSTNYRPKMVDSSTQMSRPTTPLKKSFNQSQNSILRADGSHLNPSLSFGHVTQNQSLPLTTINTIEPTDKFELQDVDQCNDVDELIANQEQTEEEEEEYDDNPMTPQKLPVEESCIAAKRIRDLGLSFIDKRDLYSTVQSPRKDEPSFWALPHASDPFKMSGPAAPIASNSKHNLMLNDKAMKYLSDEQLVQMAANSPLNQSNSSSTSRTPVNLTRYGMPENNMSLGTEKFLEKYNLRQNRPM